MAPMKTMKATQCVHFDMAQAEHKEHEIDLDDMYSFDSPRMAGPDLAAGGPPSRCATTKDAFVPGSAHDDGVYGFVITDGIMI